jgi:hypothetical protein
VCDDEGGSANSPVKEQTVQEHVLFEPGLLTEMDSVPWLCHNPSRWSIVEPPTDNIARSPKAFTAALELTRMTVMEKYQLTEKSVLTGGVCHLWCR